MIQVILTIALEILEKPFIYTFVTFCSLASQNELRKSDLATLVCLGLLLHIMPPLRCKSVKYIYNLVAYLGLPQHLRRGCLGH